MLSLIRCGHDENKFDNIKEWYCVVDTLTSARKAAAKILPQTLVRDLTGQSSFLTTFSSTSQ